MTIILTSKILTVLNPVKKILLLKWKQIFLSLGAYLMIMTITFC